VTADRLTTALPRADGAFGEGEGGHA
jgi:hypothetical protein